MRAIEIAAVIAIASRKLVRSENTAVAANITTASFHCVAHTASAVAGHKVTTLQQYSAAVVVPMALYLQ